MVHPGVAKDGDLAGASSRDRSISPDRRLRVVPGHRCPHLRPRRNHPCGTACPGTRAAHTCRPSGSAMTSGEKTSVSNAWAFLEGEDRLAAHGVVGLQGGCPRSIAPSQRDNCRTTSCNIAETSDECSPRSFRRTWPTKIPLALDRLADLSDHRPPERCGILAIRNHPTADGRGLSQGAVEKTAAQGAQTHFPSGAEPAILAL